MAPICLLALWSEGSAKEQRHLPTLLFRGKLPSPSPSPHADAKKFSFFPYISGAFLAAASMLELRVSELE